MGDLCDYGCELFSGFLVALQVLVVQNSVSLCVCAGSGFIVQV